MEAQFQGYPAAVIYVAAFIGVALMLYRPRWAFLYVVFCLAARNYHMAVYTRTPFLGEFLNLNDLFLWIGVGAMIISGLEKRKIWFPWILCIIIGILLLGTFQTLFLYGFHYQSLRETWAAWIFPIMFVVGITFVRDNYDARLFIWSLFLGSACAALQHMLSFHSSALEGDIVDQINMIRDISFTFSGGIFLVIGSLFIDINNIMKKYYLVIIWIIGLSIITISYTLSFTRTIWVGALLAGISLAVIFYRDHRRIVSRFKYVLPLIAVILLIFYMTNKLFFRDVEVTRFIEERAEFVQFDDSFEEAYGSRETGIKTELGLWLDSTIIWGMGVAYPPSLQTTHNVEERYRILGALNHVAFSSYLAHFGLIGLIAYGFLLPLFSIKIGRQIYLTHPQDYQGFVAIVAVVLAFFNIFTLPSSYHYLTATSHVQGLIYGSLWGLSRSFQSSKARYARYPIMTVKPQVPTSLGKIT